MNSGYITGTRVTAAGIFHPPGVFRGTVSHGPLLGVYGKPPALPVGFLALINSNHSPSLMMSNQETDEPAIGGIRLTPLGLTAWHGLKAGYRRLLIQGGGYKVLM